MPDGETPFSYLAELCHDGARRRYHPMTPAVVNQLAHELEVIERTGLAEFFLICWDLMRFAKERGIPAQGRGSAADSIVAYVLGITRVDPIRHNLLFERFINEGRTTYPDVDIDFCLGAPRGGHPVRLRALRRRAHRDGLQPRHLPGPLGGARGGLRAGVPAAARGPGGQGARDVRLGHGPARPRGGRRLRRVLPAAGRRIAGRGPSRPCAPRPAAWSIGWASCSTVPLVGKVPPWRQPPAPDDPAAPRPIAWLGDDPLAPRTAARGGGRRRMTRAGRATRRRASPGCVPGVAPATRRTGTDWWRRRSSTAAGWIRRVACWSRRRGRRTSSGRPTPLGSAAGRAAAPSVARVEPEPPPQPRGGSTSGMRAWERWLELCARIDGFPRHLSIHSGGMLVTAAPLIDIAPLERATMPGRVVVQYDKRDVETLKLIKLDLLGLGMLAAIDETLQLIEHDCAVCLDLDRLPEDIPEVFAMIQAADTVGVFQVESRAQMQTLPKSRPRNLDDLVVEVAIIRPGPIQGNAVHPYLRRKQGLEPVDLPPSQPGADPRGHARRDPLPGAGDADRHRGRRASAPAESDGFRRAMGTWRSSREMEKLHPRFVDGCVRQPGMTAEKAEELFRQVAAFASFGFAKSHAAAFARTAYESAFLKLFYPAQFLAGLINAQPMGFYPVEVLVNDAKRHGVAVLPVDVNAAPLPDDDRVGRAARRAAPRRRGHRGRPEPVRSRPASSPGRRRASAGSPEATAGWGIRLGLRLVKGIGEEHAARLDAELARGPYASPGGCRGADRARGGGHRAAHPGRGAGLAGAAAARAAVAAARGGRPPGRVASGVGPWRAASGPRWPAGRWTCACRRPTRRTCRR